MTLLGLEMKKIANEPGGGYIDSDGDWCLTRTPKEFKDFIELQGFKVILCTETQNCTAKAITDDDLIFCWNGYCGRDKY